MEIYGCSDAEIRDSVKLILFISLSMLLTGCPFPGSRYYRGVSSMEQRFFTSARRDIYPNEVKHSLAMYQDSQVVWPGIIVRSHVIEHEDSTELVLLLEHHYYDWVLDESIQRAKIFLSPRGEGLFQTSWMLRKEASQSSEIGTVMAPGNLALVYGTPERIEGDTVFLKCSYIRPIDKQWYRTDVMDYGREGEPVTSKKVPF